MLSGLALFAASCDPSPERGVEPPVEPPQATEQAVVAAPDAPIASGERVPRRDADTPDDALPDPADTGDLTAAISRLAQRYAGGWTAASTAFEGELAQGQHQDFQLVLGSAHCYRVLGVAEPTLSDVDLLLFDPSGLQVQQDQGGDRFPIVGQSFPVCPPQAGAYRLQVQAREGGGRIRVQAFHTP